jgi:RNA polymerase sigma factor (sigma-70 family)
MPEPTAESPKLIDATDEQLVCLATSGNAAALTELLGRQQTWIYNLAFYMLHMRADAEDATQEILVKIATSLGSFKHMSSLRTWAKKIAVHHVLDFRRSRPEQVVTGFGCYAEYLDKAEDVDLYSARGHSPETTLLVDEARISCVMGMLLCLDRQQRIVFLLGEILDTNDTLGAELLQITRENFRQQLHRAREQLAAFMSGRCGLLNQANPCRCARKTTAFLRDGIVDPANIRFARGHLEGIHLQAAQRDRELAALLGETQKELRRLYPLFAAPEVTERLSALLNSNELRAVLNLN